MLAGGTGTRLRPLTYTASKQLVPIANKPILFYGLESLAASGIEEVGIVIGHTGDEVRRAVGDGSQLGLRVTYLAQDAPRGLAHAVGIAREFLGDDDFVMYLGDNFIVGGIEEVVGSFRARDRRVVARILLAKVPDPTRFGVAEIDADGRVVGLVEKPTVPPSDLALVGVYLFDSHVHKAVASIAPSARGELEITDAISWLIREGYEVESSMVEGYWKDLGDPDALLEGNRIALEHLVGSVAGEVVDSTVEGRVVIEEGARVHGSLVRGPAIIGRGAVVDSSYIGPFTSVGPGVGVRNAEIANSILLEGASISGVGMLDGCIVGRFASIERRGARPSAHRMVLGDHSRVEML
jgi:glucose-1-phosphate thymidylyltransferase